MLVKSNINIEHHQLEKKGHVTMSPEKPECSKFGQKLFSLHFFFL